MEYEHNNSSVPQLRGFDMELTPSEINAINEKYRQQFERDYTNFFVCVNRYGCSELGFTSAMYDYLEKTADDFNKCRKNHGNRDSATSKKLTELRAFMSAVVLIGESKCGFKKVV